jgi:hypothetical protein
VKNILLSALLLITTALAFGQDEHIGIESRPVNNINLSVLGDVSLFGINYERIFFLRPHLALTGRAGTGIFMDLHLFSSKPADKYIAFPHHFSVLLGQGRHFFESGVGATFLAGYSENTSIKYYLYPIFAYRFLPLKTQKVNLRLVLPLIMKVRTETWDSGKNAGQTITKTIVYTLPGLALGISF